MPLKPTAVHARADVQDTACRSSSPGTVARTAHLRPFQRSERAPAALSPPTAMQNVADVHDTAVRKPAAGLAVCWMAHLRPFHRSASVKERPWILTKPGRSAYKPTAMHRRADVHDTASS